MAQNNLKTITGNLSDQSPFRFPLSYGPTPFPVHMHADMNRWYYSNYDQPTTMTVFDEVYRPQPPMEYKENVGGENYISDAFYVYPLKVTDHDRYWPCCPDKIKKDNYKTRWMLDNYQMKKTIEGVRYPYRYHPALDPYFQADNNC